MKLPSLSAVMHLAYLIWTRLALPMLVIGWRLYIALIWTGELTILDTLQLLITASSFGPAFLTSTLIFCAVWRTHLFFPDNTKDADGNPIPSIYEVLETVYRPDGTKHEGCRCKKTEWDVHLLRCGHLISHKALNEGRHQLEGPKACTVCHQLVWHEGKSAFTTTAKFLVGVLCAAATMLGMGMALVPNAQMNALRVVVLALILRYLFAVGKIRDLEGRAWWCELVNTVPFYTRFDYLWVITVPFVALVATWTVERLFGQIIDIPAEIFSIARGLTLTSAIARWVWRV